MNEMLIEQLVERVQTKKTNAIKTMLMVVTVLSMLLFFLSPIFILLIGIIAIVDFIVFRRLNVEYEYIYFDGSLDIDRIMNKQSRKRMLSTDIKELEMIAPKGSDQTRVGEQVKVLDFSSQSEEHKQYEMITTFKGEKVKVIFEPKEEILKSLWNKSPRKIII